MFRFVLYRSVDEFLARPGRKQAGKQVRDARDFNNIETRSVSCFPPPPPRQGLEGNSRHCDRNISLFPSWSGFSTPCIYTNLVTLRLKERTLISFRFVALQHPFVQHSVLLNRHETYKFRI